jgi:DUF917 family protein
MGKITDMIVSAIMKKGVLYEARNCDVEFEIPSSELSGKEGTDGNKIKIRFKAENMTLRIEKE